VVAGLGAAFGAARAELRDRIAALELRVEALTASLQSSARLMKATWSTCRRSFGREPMPFDRRSYLAGYRRGLQTARRELRQAERRIDEQVAEVRDELGAARRQLERLHRIDAALDADAGDWHELALH
jgi:hypothetical protein